MRTSTKPFQWGFESRSDLKWLVIFATLHLSTHDPLIFSAGLTEN